MENCTFEEPEGFVLDENPIQIDPSSLALTRAQIVRLDDDKQLISSYIDTIKDVMRMLVQMIEYVENEQAGPPKAQEVLDFMGLLMHQYENYAEHEYVASLAEANKDLIVRIAAQRFKPRNSFEPVTGSGVVSGTVYLSNWSTIETINRQLFSEELPGIWSKEFTEYRMFTVADTVADIHVAFATDYLKPYFGDQIYTFADGFKTAVMQDKELRETLLQLPPQLRESEAAN